MKQTNIYKISKIITSIFPDDIKSVVFSNNELFLLVQPQSIKKILTFLKLSTLTQFKQLVDMSGVDYPERAYRFEVIYHLLSIKYNARINIRSYTNELTPLSSVTAIYSGANWSEREIWDLFGVYFKDHPDLRRILTDYGFDGHPLRKDFPLVGYKEIRYDDSSRRIVYEPIEFAQEYRHYDYTSPWQHLEHEP